MKFEKSASRSGNSEEVPQLVTELSVAQINAALLSIGQTARKAELSSRLPVGCVIGNALDGFDPNKSMGYGEWRKVSTVPVAQAAWWQRVK